MDVATEIDALLAPWRHSNGKLLGGVMFTLCEVRECDPVLWIEWSFPENDSETYRCVECLQLLDVISTFDTAAFHRLLCDVTEDLHSTLVEHPACVAWQLGVQIDVDEGDDLDLLGDLFQWMPNVVGDEHCRGSAKFKDVKKYLEIRSNGTASQRLIPVRLVVSAGPEGDSDNMSTLQQVKRLYEAATNVDGPSCFRLHACHLEFPAGCVTTEYLQLVLEILRQGMNVNRVTINGELGPVDLHLQAKVLQALLRPRSVIDFDAGSSFSGVSQLVIRANVDPRLQAPLFSALRESASVHHLTLDTFDRGAEDDAIRSSWNWLAFALFSAASLHSIDALEVFASGITTDQVEIVDSVSQHSDPIALVAPTSSFRIPGSALHAINAERGTEVWIGSISSEPADVVLENDFTNLPVIGTAKEGWVRTMIPGYGVCVIRWEKDLAQADIACQSSRQGFRSIGFQHLPANSGTDCLALLRSIGRATHRLALRGFDNDFDADTNAWMRECLLACPLVRELVIPTYRMQLLDSVIEETLRGTCQIRRLCVSGIADRVKFESLQQLLASLSESEHPLASNLCELIVAAYYPARHHSLSTWDDILDALESMLARNNRLISCRWHSPASAGYRDKCTSLFRALDGQVLSIRAGPLALASKLAFISVIRNSSASCSSLGGLSSDALALIFAFAARCKRRTCLFL